jgi:hypothetical protein
MKHKSEADIVGHTVRQAERLEKIDDPDEMHILDVTYTVTGDGKVTGVQFLMTMGGPNITVNALQGTVVGSWGGNTHTTHFVGDVVRDYARHLADMHEQQYGGN